MTTTMATAATLEEPALLRQMLAAGMSPDGDGDAAVTPLIAAAQYQRVRSIELLLEAGADPCRQDAQGRTAWWYASRRTVDFVVPFRGGTHGSLFLPRLVQTPCMRMLARAMRQCGDA
jgi:hypothetical protein